MITKESIKEVFKLNEMSGNIETGYRYWISEYKTVSYYANENLSITCKFINNLPFGSSPIEQSKKELNKMVLELIDKIYKEYTAAESKNEN